MSIIIRTINEVRNLKGLERQKFYYWFGRHSCENMRSKFYRSLIRKHEIFRMSKRLRVNVNYNAIPSDELKLLKRELSGGENE